MIDSISVFVIGGILTLVGAIKKTRKEKSYVNKFFCHKCGKPRQFETDIYCRTCHYQGAREPAPAINPKFSKKAKPLIIKEWP